MEKNAQVQLIKSLQREAGVKQEAVKFERAKMDQLHALYAQMSF